MWLDANSSTRDKKRRKNALEYIEEIDLKSGYDEMLQLSPTTVV